MNRNQKRPKEKHALISLEAIDLPSLVESTGRSTYVRMGVDDKYADLLMELSQKSPTHGSLCQRIGQMINGGGLKATRPEIDVWMEKVGLHEAMRRVAIDYKIFGGSYLDIRWSADGTEIKRIFHLPWVRVRAEEDIETLDPDHYVYCYDWHKRNQEKVRIAAFGKTKLEDGTRPLREVLPIRRYTVGLDYYAEPDYVAALGYAKLEASIGEFHNANMQNGMMPSYHITWMAGNLSDDAEDEIYRKLENKLAGSRNAGKWLIHFVDDMSQSPKFDLIPNTDADKMYALLSAESRDKLILAHGVTTPTLFGIQTAGKLGSLSEMAEGWQIFQVDYLDPIQHQLAKAVQEVYCAQPQYTQMAAEKGLIHYDVTNPFAPEPSTPAPTTPEAPEAEPQAPTDEVLAALQSFSSQIDGSMWSEVHAVRAEPEYEDERDALLRLVSGTHLSIDGQSTEDTSIFLVRYRYAPQTIDQGTKGYESRKFCRTMVGESQTGAVYKREDIERMSTMAVNEGFGPEGAATYDIWLYKGGARCHHFWERVVFMKADQQQVSSSTVQKILNQMDPYVRDVARIDRRRTGDDRLVAKRPIDMPNEGFLKKR